MTDNAFRDKLRSLQFVRGNTKKVRKHGRVLGEVHTDHQGKISSTVTPEVHVINTRGSADVRLET